MNNFYSGILCLKCKQRTIEGPKFLYQAQYELFLVHVLSVHFPSIVFYTSAIFPSWSTTSSGKKYVKVLFLWYYFVLILCLAANYFHKYFVCCFGKRSYSLTCFEEVARLSLTFFCSSLSAFPRFSWSAIYKKMRKMEVTNT